MRARVIQFICVLVALASLTGAQLLTPSIVDLRMQEQLTLSDKHIETMPPHVRILTQALGAFRGLIINIFWYQATEAKQEGRFSDAKMLSEWICQLQPQFSQVWSFRAWELAFNYSVQTYTPEERWEWVKKGIELLRDEGVKWNPKAARLYRELGWIFFFKIGREADDVHWYYKAQLAEEWQEVLGSPPEVPTTAQAIAQFKLIADAPERLDQVIEKDQRVKEVVKILNDLRYKVDTSNSSSTLRQIGRALMFVHSVDANVLGVSWETMANAPFDQRLLPLITDPKHDEPLAALLAYLRKRALFETYNMDPAFMLGLMERFGPLDWRHSCAHSLYWAEMGVHVSRDLRNKKNVDLLNTYREGIHSIQQLMYEGRISYDPFTGRIDLLPDPRFIPSYEAALEAIPEWVAPFGSGTVETFQTGRENFLLTAMMYSYLWGDEAQARHYYEKVVRDFGNKDDQAKVRYRQPMHDLIIQRIGIDIDSPAHSRQFVTAMLRRVFIQGWLDNRGDLTDRFMSMAAHVHKQFNDRGVPDPKMPERGRMTMPPLDEMLKDTYIDLMANPANDMITKIKLWRVTPLNIQRDVFKRVQVSLYKQAEQLNLDPARTFPPPQGVDLTLPEAPAEPPPTQGTRQAPM